MKIVRNIALVLLAIYGLLWGAARIAEAADAVGVILTSRFNAGVTITDGSTFTLDSMTPHVMMGSTPTDTSLGPMTIYTPSGRSAADTVYYGYIKVPASVLWRNGYASAVSVTADYEVGGVKFSADAQLYSVAPLAMFVDTANQLLEAITVTSVDSVRKVYLVDSLDQSITASATVGTGAYVDTFIVVDTSASPDDTLENQNFTIHNLARTTKYGQTTGSSGLAGVVHLDDGSWTASIQGPTYYQDGGIDTLTLPAADTNIKIQVYQFSPTAAGTADSITLYTTMPSLEFILKVTPLPVGPGHKDTAGGVILPDPQYGVPNSSTKVAQVTVLRSAACDPALNYRVEIFRKGDAYHILDISKFTTASASSEEIDW